MLQLDKREQIRRLNDQFRRSMTGGQVVVTAGARNLGKEVLSDILRAVQGFSEFDEHNDPHGEHDFGRLEIDGHELFWKIDYYDQTLTFRSPDPTSPMTTLRVLTIMLAEEY